jgi:hypothetical protein
MNMEHWYNDVDRGNRKYWETNLYHCHTVHHTCHINWPGIEPEPTTQ